MDAPSVNSYLAPATSSNGEPLVKVTFPKSKKGGCTAKPVRAEPAFHHADALLDLVFENIFQDPAPYLKELQKIPDLEHLSAQCDRPDKEDVRASYVSRFNPGEL